MKHLASIISFSLVIALLTPTVAANFSSDCCFIEFSEITGEESSEAKEKDGNEQLELDDYTLIDHLVRMDDYVLAASIDVDREVNVADGPMIQTPPPE